MQKQLFVIVQLIVRISANFTISAAADLALEIGVVRHSSCFRLIHTNTPTITESKKSFLFIRKLMLGLENQSGNKTAHLNLRTITALTFEQFNEYQEKVKLGLIYETCNKPLEIFFATPNNLHNFAWLSQKYDIAKTTWLVFMINNYTEEHFFQTSNLKFNVNLLTAKTRGASIVINEVFRVTPTSEMKVITIGTWTETLGLKIDSQSIYNRRTDLNGMVFRLGAVQTWPITTLTENTNNDIITLEGFFPNIWKDLEKLMNFTSIAYRSVDNATGTVLNNKWNGLVGMLLRNEIDVIISELNINVERTNVIDFPHPLIRTHYQVYYKMPGYNLSWLAVLDPFDSWLWFALLAWLILGAALLAVFYKMCRKSEHSREMYQQPASSFFFMLQSLCQQGYWQIPESYACRILFLLAYIMSAIIIPSYAGSLISSLTAQTPYRPFDSFEEMLEFKDQYKIVMKQFSAEYTRFEKATDPLYKKVFRELVDHKEGYRLDTTGRIAEKLCGNNYYSMFAVESTTDPQMALLTECRIIKFSKPLSTIYQGLGLRKWNPYTGLINFHLGRMINSGIISRQYQAAWPNQVTRHVPAFQQVSSSQVFQIFVLLAAGIVLSVIVLGIELATTQRRGKSKRKRDWIASTITYYP